MEDIEEGGHTKKNPDGSPHGSSSGETQVGSHFGHDEIGKMALGFVWVTAVAMGLGRYVY